MCIRDRDPWARVADDRLLAALRGKDVLVVFVESYGRTALEDQAGSAALRAQLDAGSTRLSAAGWSARSAWLTSPTFAGISWLAHSTLQSGTWVDTQRRYDALLATDRVTLSSAFADAGWRTVAVVPSNEKPWPEGQAFYGYDHVYDESNMGYAGRRFGYATMPDQYTLSALQRLELADRTTEGLAFLRVGNRQSMRTTSDARSHRRSVQSLGVQRPEDLHESLVLGAQDLDGVHALLAEVHAPRLRVQLPLVRPEVVPECQLPG